MQAQEDSALNSLALTHGVYLNCLLAQRNASRHQKQAATGQTKGIKNRLRYVRQLEVLRIARDDISYRYSCIEHIDR